MAGDWLDRRWVWLVLALAAAVPLAWPQVPPLVDVLGHMGRYHIQTQIDRVPSLAEAFSFQWKLLGNLGVDLLIVPLSALFGVEFGTKLIALAIPPLTAIGMLRTAREVHGRVPPTVLFALPLAYAYPFQFGFINFSLSVAFAWNALALWIRLGRFDRLKLRTALFLPLACLLWLTHMVGWGLFGLAAFGSELVRRLRAGEPVVRTGFMAGVTCLALALPLIPMILLRTDSPETVSFDWFNWNAKIFWITSLLRDRWELWDVLSAWALFLIVAIAAVKRRFDPLLGVPVLLCLAAFVLMPRVAVGSAYADMRLLPFTMGLALLAIRSEAKWIAAAGLLFVGTRLAATTASFLLFDQSYRSELQALEQLPRGASALSLVVRPCGNSWTTPRLDHLPALAIVRRDAFTNDQWTVDSAQGLEVIKPGVGRYGNDPSQLVYPKQCRGEGSDLDTAVAEFNRATFDHVWVLGGRVNATDLRPIWSNGHSTLYRVVR
ncbi:hypothetical protein [Sphingomonas sp.]|jgi:hypothetical protein|uniref:hypothetical protein n=1 Tax=Sphingomonas sp. TaxID=28214 RepID=UPI002DF6D59F|nr:hypothetical protein [Sphingomonas sp.]